MFSASVLLLSVQFDSSGEGVLITTHDRLDHYVGMLTHQVRSCVHAHALSSNVDFVAQMPIESNFIGALPDHLNAEIVSGTVTNIREAVTWLSYTYLYIRMLRNPMIYGTMLLLRQCVCRSNCALGCSVAIDGCHPCCWSRLSIVIYA